MGQAMQITTVCCECKKVIYQGLERLDGGEVSHGQCAACEVKYLWLNGLGPDDITDYVKDAETRHAI